MTDRFDTLTTATCPNDHTWDLWVHVEPGAKDERRGVTFAEGSADCPDCGLVAVRIDEPERLA